MKRITGSVDPQAASLTMDWSPLDTDVLWCVCFSVCAHSSARVSCASSFGAVIFELAAGHIMASPAMHESHLPSWTSPHIRIMLGSIFNAHGASGLPVPIALPHAEHSCLDDAMSWLPLSLCSVTELASLCVRSPPRIAEVPTVDDLLELPFFAETAEQKIEPSSR
jgi:hypothetical protein